MIETDNQKRLNAILECSRLGTWEWNVQTGEMRFDNRWAEILGYSLDELAPVSIKTWERLTQPDDRKVCSELLRQHFSGEKPYYDAEFRMRHKDDHWVWVRDRGRVISWTEDGQPLLMLGSHEVIAERKQTEESMLQSESLMRYIIKYDPNAIAVYDRDLHYIAASDRYLQDYNIAGCEIEGKHHYEVFPEMPKRWKDIHQRVLQGMVEKNDDDFFERPDGSITYNRWECRPWYKADGTIGGMITYTEVTTERKTAELALRKSEERFRSFIENANDIIYQVSPEGRFLYTSPNWTEKLGYRIDEVIGEGVGEFVHPDDLHLCIEFLNLVLTTGQKQSGVEYRVRHKDGTWRWHVSNGSPLKDEQGNVVSYMGIARDITERKAAEEALRRSEEVLQQMLASVPDMISIHDPELNIVYSNWNGFGSVEDSKRSLGTKCYKTYRGHDTICPDCRAQQVLETKESFQEEVRLPDGTWIDLRVLPLLDANGKPYLFVEWVQDITEQKRAIEALQESEKRFATAFKHSPAPLVLSETDTGLFIDVNDRWVEMLECTREEQIGRTSIDVGIWADPADRRRIVGILQSNGRFRDEFIKFRTKSGNTVLALWSAEHVNLSGKQVMLSMIENITERKRTEEQLATERERLAVTLESIGDGVIATDTKGNVVLLNKAAQEMTGWSSTQAEGRPLSEVFHIINEVTRQRCTNPVEQVLKTGRTVELANHTALLTKDNREIIIADSAAPIKTAEAETIGVVLVFRDMTQKLKLESAIEVSSKLESLGVLAGGIAHDFNNLLGGIYGYIDMALESAEEPRTSQYLSKTVSTIERARDLTQQLLTFAKGGAPVQEVAPLFPFVQETAQFAISGSNVSCSFDIHQDLWDCNFDRNQIGQVIDNLIINAQQAMPVGGTIKVSARNIALAKKEHPLLPEGNYVRIAVKDSGVGIPKELLAKIFDPFFTTKTKGHGLGLATCYSIINRHGGCIDVYSEPGNGTVFNVYLPAADAPADSAGTQSATQHTGSGTFLIMDDEDVMRDILKDMLTSFGYTVMCMDNGKEALEVLAAESKAGRPVRAMIFDLTVPGGMGGMETIAELRRTDSKTPVFVASGYAEGPVMKNPVEYGFTAGICKPFRRIELMEMLEKYLP